MYSLSRILLRGGRISIVSSRVACAQIEVSSTFLEAKDGVSVLSSSAACEVCQILPRLYHSGNTPFNIFLDRRAHSSSTDLKSSEEEENSEDEFSELDVAVDDEAENSIDTEAADSSISNLSGDEDAIEEPQVNDLESSDTENLPKRRAYSELFKAIEANPGLSMKSLLDMLVEEGKDLSRREIYLAMIILRNRQMFGRALKIFEWLEANKRLEFAKNDYASRLDLTAKVYGLHEAENYFKKIPEALKDERIYQTLLANYVKVNHVKKAVEVFDKMRDLKFPVSSFACNQLLVLYRKNDLSKVADVLSFMEKENVKATRFTYQILLNIKGFLRDIDGMEQIVETMKEEGVDLDSETRAGLARHYFSAGLEEKALEMLKEMEGEGLEASRRWLLPLYAELGKADDVERIWASCEKEPRYEDSVAAIEAWGKLKNIKKAEAVFSKMMQNDKRPSTKPYQALMNVYAKNKMLTKGKDLIKRMAESGIKIFPQTWDVLVKLYVEAGEVEKADSILNKVTQEIQMKPMFESFMLILDQYAKKGDVHNSEKIFHRMRLAGYLPRLRQYQALVLAYKNAKAPVYGMMERLKGDKVFPTKFFTNQLARVDAFRKTEISDIID